jgi:hypothetical protein
MNEQFRMVDGKHGSPEVLSVLFERVELPDNYSRPEDSVSGDPEYAEEDKARVRAYYRGEWSYIGVQARATLRIPVGGGSFALYTLASPGLWGTEDDSGAEYLEQVYQDELACLKAHLRTLCEQLPAHLAD